MPRSMPAMKNALSTVFICGQAFAPPWDRRPILLLPVLVYSEW
jgi:hypothetical protein